MSDNPKCDWSSDDRACKAPQWHEGYLHASTLEEIEAEIASNETVYDVDGDEVVSIEPDSDEAGIYVVTYRNRDGEENNYSIRPHEDGRLDDEVDYGYVLVRLKPPTQEELDEVFDFLGVPLDARPNLIEEGA